MSFHNKDMVPVKLPLQSCKFLNFYMTSRNNFLEIHTHTGENYYPRMVKYWIRTNIFSLQ